MESKGSVVVCKLLQIFHLCRNQLKLDSPVDFTVKSGSYLLLKPLESSAQIQMYLPDFIAMSHSRV